MSAAAMVLAAGLGTRLQPLTHGLPKPAVPVLGLPVLAHALEALAEAGVRRAVVNSHHLHPQLAALLARVTPQQLELSVSHEPRILGTAGGLAQAAPMLRGHQHVLLLNGDSIWELDLAQLLRAHSDSGALATLVLRANPDPERYAPVLVDRQRRILSIAGRPGKLAGEPAQALMFAGVHVLDAALLDRLPAGPCDINRDVYPDLLEAGATLLGQLHDAYWHDLGTPWRLLAANLEALAQPPARLLARARRSSRLEAGNLLSHGALLAPGCRVERSLLAEDCRVGSSASVSDSLLLAGCRVASGASLRSCVLGPGTEVGAGARLERLLVVADGSTRPIGDA